MAYPSPQKIQQQTIPTPRQIADSIGVATPSFIRAPTAQEKKSFFQPPKLSPLKKIANVFLPKKLEFKLPNEFDRRFKQQDVALEETGFLAPPSVVKVPFVNKGFAQPKTSGVFGDTLKFIVETPERTVNTLRDVSSVLKTGKIRPRPDPETEKKIRGVPIRVETSFDEGEKIYQAARDGGFSEGQSRALEAAYTFSAGTLDITVIGSILSSGAKNVLRKVAVPEIEQTTAWRFLGSKPTQKEALDTAKQLLHDIHPDTVIARGGTQAEITASNKLAQDINNAVKIIKEKGIPVTPPTYQRVTRDIARYMEADPNQLLRSNFKLPVEVDAPFAKIAGELPGFRSKSQIPSFGLSTREIEPVGFGSLKPLADEAVKYSSADDFIKAFNNKMKGFDPFGDITKIPKTQSALHQAFMEYTQKPEIQTLYEAGKISDEGALARFYNEVKTQTSVDLSDTDLGATYEPTAKTPEAFTRAEQRSEIRAIKQETMDKAKEIYDKKVAGIKDAKEILARRRSFVRAVQAQFSLSDADLRSITQKDIRLMSNLEFKTYLDLVRVKSEQLAQRRQARTELEVQIKEKELDVEPLRQALNLPKISEMSSAELQTFDETLSSFEKGDVFLSKRKLETVERTELEGIKTYREARERLAAKLGVDIEKINNIKISEFDRFKGPSALAETNPFFKMMVEETAKLRLVREAEFLEIEKTANELASKLQTSFVQKLIPQQKNIVAWFEAKDKSKVALTDEESDLVEFMIQEWGKARDYLIEQKALTKGMKSENYFTHVRRGILEAAKEDGVIQAAKEVFQQYKLDEQTFNILDRETGQVLALDKFFKFALQRTGELKPSANVVGSFLNYMKTFKTKQALDEIVPLINIYAHALTPPGVTKTGLLLHGDLMRFVKEWLNTQKGRRITLLAKEGGKLDFGLQAARTFTTMLDLALSIPVSVATQMGEQAVAFQLLGRGGFLKAKYRSLTPKGRRVVEKYRNLIGKNPWSQLIAPARSIGDRLNEGMFAIFSGCQCSPKQKFPFRFDDG